ncbi:hypothetical protein MMC07_006713 [Pseudocyphellaria aurata]|nr:hypothetical protein [Pseudocyphellaria aurata]
MLSPRSPSLQPAIPPTLPSSPFNPSAFNSTLALPFTRPTSASAIHTRKPSTRSKRALAASRQRRTRSVVSSTSSSVSATDFSMAEFTIDLAKLGEKESGMTMPDDETGAEGIGSEDDGPEDFTLNLEKWMRGDQSWRRGAGGDFDTKDELQNVKEQVVGLQDEKGAIERSLDTEKKYHEHAGLEVGSLRARYESIVQELAAVRSAADAEKKTADERIATLNTKLLTSQMEIIKQQKDSNVVIDAKQDEIKNLILECQHLKSESSGCRQALEAQVLASQKEILKERKDFEALETRIHNQIREVILKIDQYHNDILSYRQALQEREEQAEDHASEITRLIMKVEAAKDLESSLALQKMDLDHAQELLRETRCSVHIVKEEKDRLTKETERQNKENAEIADLLARKGTELQAAESIIDKLRDELTSPQREKHAGATGVEPHEPALTELQMQHQTGIQEMKTAHEKELKSLKSTILRASDSIRKREQRFEKRHREELASLRQKIASLEISKATKATKATSNPPMPASASSADVAKLRDAARILWSQLAAVTAALQGTRLALTESQDALAESRAQTADTRASQAAALQELEEQFAVAVEAREKEWRRRIGIMFRDREKMSKALLWAWGREEVGDKGKEHESGKQGYRYRFVER